MKLLRVLTILCAMLAMPLAAQAKLILADTGDTVEVVTASGVSTINVYAAWADITTTALTPGMTNSLITTATTTTVVAAPGASTQRQVKMLTIYNSHASSSNAISVQVYDGTNRAVLVKYTLLAGETLQWSEDENFRVLDASGQMKAVASADTELPAAAQSTTTGQTAPTAPFVNAYIHCQDASATTISPCVASPSIAHDAAAASANPLLTGCYANAAAPTDVSADIDAVREWCLRNGARAIQPTFAGVLASAGNGVSGTGVQRVTIASDSTGVVGLAAGSNTIGALTANQSVNVAQINGVTTLMGAGNTGTGSQRVTEATDSQLSAGVGATGDAAATAGSTGSITAKLRLMTSQLDTMSTALASLLTSSQLVDDDQTGASLSHRISVGTTEDEWEVKGSAGRLFSITATNTNAAVRYLRCANQVIGSTTPGTTSVFYGMAIPGATTGAGFTANFGPSGIAFSTGLTCWLVTGAAETDVAEVAANEINVNIAYK